MKAPAAAAAPDEARVWCPHCCALDAPAGLALEDGEIRASCGHCHGTFSLGPMRGLRAPIARLTLVSSPSRVALVVPSVSLSQASFSVAPSVPPVVPRVSVNGSVAHGPLSAPVHAPERRTIPLAPTGGEGRGEGANPRPNAPHVAASLSGGGSVAHGPLTTQVPPDVAAHAPSAPRGVRPAATTPYEPLVQHAARLALASRPSVVQSAPSHLDAVVASLGAGSGSATLASPSQGETSFELELPPEPSVARSADQSSTSAPASAEAQDPFLAPDTHCPKCIAERGSGPACTRCGLIFAQANTAHWQPPRWLSERWKLAWHDWHNPTHHQTLVDRAQQHDALPALARLYRLRLLWAPGDAVAEAASAEVVRRASFPLVAGPRVNVASQRQRRLLVGVMALAVVLVSLGLWALRFLSVA